MMKKRRMMLLKMREIWTMISKRTKRQKKKTMLLKEKEIRKKQWPDIDITYYQT